MATVFFDSEGLLLVDIMPHGTTINSDGYVATLKKFQVRLSRVRRHREKQDVLLLHDNAQAYVSHKTTDQIRNSFSDLTSVLCLREMDSVPNVIVLREKLLKINEEIRLELVTNSFKNRYPNTTLQILCDWDGVQLIPEDCTPFPDKISNMQGRNIKISTFSWYFPYISMKNLDGTENRLMAELSKKLNFTIDIIINKEWGTFQPDGTGKGIHRDLLIGVADIGIGGILIVYQNALYFDFTMPYLFNGITMLVPRPKPLPLWVSIVAPFRTSLWLLVVGSVLAGSLALYVCALLLKRLYCSSRHINIYADFKHCFLIVLGQLTQVPTSTWPYEAPLRHLLTWQFIFFVLITTGYKSSLIGCLRYRRYEKTIDSPQDFASVPNLYWTAVDESWPSLLASFSDSALQEIHSRYKRFPNVTAINKALHDCHLAIAVENLATGGYSGADYINKDFIASSMWLMTYDLSTTMVAMELQRGSPYAKHFDDEGLSSRQVASRLGLNQSDVVRTWNRFRNPGIVDDMSRSGRPRATTECDDTDDRYLRIITTRNAENTAGMINNDFQTAIGRRVPNQTVRNRLHDSRLHSRRPWRGPTLTPRHTTLHLGKKSSPMDCTKLAQSSIHGRMPNMPCAR
ncbi:hypothetical protein ANN_25073 [Periplaneta americana]|uniref:Ionotropic receptor n=1 Tax=Periplaneta americana TaxID=6978 RepID=A0ABQ8S0N9_PERAM|nr:hypothetical protein ANN_25073 [Periplaneta americana]